MPIKIIAAVYAANKEGKDVTQDCIQIVAGGSNVIPVNDTTFGEPDYGATKYFTITYSNGAQTFYQGCQEGTNLVLSPS